MGRPSLLAAVSVAALVLGSGLALADGYESSRLVGPPPFSWTGFYIGTQDGGAWGHAHVSDPFGKSIYGDNVRTPGPFTGAVIGFNYQQGRTVIGVEADANWADLDGTNTCLAFSGNFVSSNCRVHNNAFGTVTGRIGTVLDAGGRTLLYAKGGLAWLDQSVDVASGNNFFNLFTPPLAPSATASSSDTRWGWTVGAGAERALQGGWSLKFEYDYLRFGSQDVTTPVSNFVTPVGAFAIVPSTTTHVSQDVQEFKVGVNYRFGANAVADADFGRGSVRDARVPGLEFEYGARYWYSLGRFQWDNDRGDGVIESRLTYNTTGHAGELFGRVDTPMNIFVKGNLGIGTLTDGRMHDEDWGLPFGAFISYSNTVSSEKNGDLRYGTVDVGYDVMRGRDYKVGFFIGYNYYNEFMNSYGCVQIANPAFPCLAPNDTQLIGNQDATWQSLRIGVSHETRLTDRLKITGDIAYLPYVSMSGRDNHLLRQALGGNKTFFDDSGTGQGMQVEAILSYAVTEKFNLGVGARYWAMRTDDATFTCTGCGAPGVTSAPFPAKFSTERYGLLLQGSWQFYSDRELQPLK